jgi:hypothetical protein
VSGVETTDLTADLENPIRINLNALGLPGFALVIGVTSSSSTASTAAATATTSATTTTTTTSAGGLFVFHKLVTVLADSSLIFRFGAVTDTMTFVATVPTFMFNNNGVQCGRLILNLVPGTSNAEHVVQSAGFIEDSFECLKRGRARGNTG